MDKQEALEFIKNQIDMALGHIKDEEAPKLLHEVNLYVSQMKRKYEYFLKPEVQKLKIKQR